MYSTVKIRRKVIEIIVIKIIIRHKYFILFTVTFMCDNIEIKLNYRHETNKINENIFLTLSSQI